VLFRRDSKVDAFQRQISALRHQLGGDADELPAPVRSPSPNAVGERSYRSEYSDLDPIAPAGIYSTREDDVTHSPADEPQLPAVPAIDLQTSVIAHSTTWTGNLESTGSLHVHGRVDGALTAREDIFIAEEADVDAVVRAANVIIAGNVRGSISCSDRFEILPRGRVLGNVQAPVIIIHEGGMIAGDIAMSRPAEAVGASSPHFAARTARGGD
jgi:cytoskeletal protein CcmA (bactofilin family)